MPDLDFDSVIEWLVIGLLAFMAVSFGGVATWSELVIVVLCWTMLITLALKLVVRQEEKLVWTWAYVPMILFGVIILFQLIPLPASLLNLLSPGTVATKTRLWESLPYATGESREMTLSFYPLATRTQMRLILVTSSVFIVIVNVYRRTEQIRRLLGAVVVMGGAMALLALAQFLFDNGRIFWIYSTRNSLAPSGTFVNHNHFGQFMNLSIGAGLGLLFMRVGEIIDQGKNSTFTRDRRKLLSFFRWELIIAAVIIISITAILLSLTRGGIMSLILAGGFTVLMIAHKYRKGYMNWIMAGLALGVFICIVLIAFNMVFDRVATLADSQAYQNRWSIIKSMDSLIGDYPLWGTGLGTFEYVFPMVDRSLILGRATHAENEYAQILSETGLIGLGVVLFFVVIICRNYWRSIRHIHPPVRWAAFGLGFGLLAVMIQSVSDFGQHVPANACLSAVFCGLLIRLTRLHHDRYVPRIKGGKWSGWARPVVLVFLVGISTFMLNGALRACQAKNKWRQAQVLREKIDQNQKHSGWKEFAQIIGYAQEAVHHQSDNVVYRYGLSVYRWEALVRINTNNKDQIIQAVRDINRDLYYVCELCPTYGPAYGLSGQLERYVLNNPEGSAGILTAYELYPNNISICITAGEHEALCGNFESAQKIFRHYLALGGSFNEPLKLYIDTLDKPELAAELAGENAGQLYHLAGVLNRKPAYKELSDRLRHKALELLEQKRLRPDLSAGMLAGLAYVYYQEKDYELAIEYYRRALALDYGRVQWRLLLARLLAETNQISEAVHEARICLRLYPRMPGAEELLAKLSLAPDNRENKL
ncbi:MAG: O-antigen ligase family protein [Sedimentisphaerales bacterium]|nr:O-antigen ligase family protein [Sedimentisphaerales bacterium]